MKAALIAIGVLVLLSLGAGRKYVTVREELVHQRHAMSEAWAQVDDVLQKHAGAVAGLLDEESGPGGAGGVRQALRRKPQTLRDLEDAHAALLSGHSPEEKIQANSRLDAALAKVLLLSDSTASSKSRHSKSSKAFARLEAEMAEAESRIALPRRKYNEALEHYNALIQKFPENLVASVAGFGRNDAYFKTELGRLPTKATF